MRKLFIVLVAFLAKSAFSQTLRLDCDFNLDFIYKENPFKDLTEYELNEERMHYKIKSIVKERLGKSVDSVYLNDKKHFDNLVKYPAWSHLLYNYVEIFDYDEFGILKSCLKYPVSKFLTKEDSINQNPIRYEYQRKVDSIYSKKYIRNELREEWVYYKESLIYYFQLEPIMIWEKDTANKGYHNKEIGREWNRTTYKYLKEGKLDRILHKNDLKYQYEYSHEHKALVTFYDSDYLGGFDDTTWVLQNEISRNSSGAVQKCVFTNKGHTELKVIYDVYRDSLKNVFKITKTIDDKGLYEKPHIEKEYQYKNVYDRNKLKETSIINYSGSWSKPQRVIYNEKGLNERRYLSDFEEVFKYSFYN